jgi:Dolichyl-phosphate-mannose-protein mannosyltransferase
MRAAARPIGPDLAMRWYNQPDFIAAAILSCGFLLRLRAAWGTFLNPDEAMHVLAANQSLAATYRASLETAHPPILLFVLNFWRVLGNSECLWRLPSVIAGTVFCWIFFLWLRDLFGQDAAWIGLTFATFLPPLIELSAEVRQYALLLCFLILACYFLERGLAADSPRLMSLSFLFLYLAMLTHFSAILFAGAVGAYSLLRLIRLPKSRRVVRVWAAGMAGAVGLFLFLYRTQISLLKGSDVAQRMGQLLSRSYFHWGRDHLLLFALARTFGVCQWVFGQLAIGDVAGLAFFAGVMLLLRTNSDGRSLPSRRFVGIFLLLPFATNCAAGVADIYPYGGTRHSAFLAPFVLAGVSWCMAKLSGVRPRRGIIAAAVIVAACSLFGAPHRPYMLRRDQDTDNMARAVEAIHHDVSSDDLIFVDFQSYFMVRYYLCPQIGTEGDTIVPGFRSFSCGKYKVISTGPDINIFSAATFLPSWEKMVSIYRLKPGETIWIFQAGWDIRITQQLQQNLPEFENLRAQSFGRNIDLFPLKVGAATFPSPAGQQVH